ncbi:SdiA-regulated domain-containing protein [Pontibacter locisalis]|uniref:SdiA-regulated domain-containing protein n=1 Tax=Pontibacter locisalis TaxID=1719035 RepID=A0ABW5IN00_9BACT
MMKRFLGLVLLTVLNGCNSIWNRADIPEAVKVRFTELYPTAKKVTWENEPHGFEAEFNVNRRERNIMFNARGELLSSSEEVEAQYLPEEAHNKIRSRYAAYEIEEVNRVVKQQQTYYEVVLEQGTHEFVLILDSDGNLLNQLQDTQRADMQKASLMKLSAPEKVENLLNSPEVRWELPSELREVSGIAFLQRDLLACVQDEEGAIFLYDLNQRAIARKINFAGPGDYEGLSVVNNTAYVLRSDGALYEVANFLTKQPKTILHESVLAATQNTEGLGYDAESNRLLIACKGFDKSLGDNKGIYAFRLSDKKMVPVPVIKVPLAQERLGRAGKKTKNRYSLLQPSSLEINPATGDLYLLDAANHRLLVLNRQGQVQKSLSLDKGQLRQPEGMTFGDAGELYIASEGAKKGKAVVLKFSERL